MEILALASSKKQSFLVFAPLYVNELTLYPLFATLKVEKRRRHDRGDIYVATQVVSFLPLLQADWAVKPGRPACCFISNAPTGVTFETRLGTS